MFFRRESRQRELAFCTFPSATFRGSFSRVVYCSFGEKAGKENSHFAPFGDKCYEVFFYALIIFSARLYVTSSYFCPDKSTKNACSMSATGSAPPRFSRSADSRRGYFVSLRNFYYTLHYLLPLISDVEYNQPLTTGQADSILFSKNVAVMTRLMCSAVCSLLH